MKKILGLDLGSSSIGWAYIIESEQSRTIQKLGVRIVPIDSTARDAFSKGQSISINKDRTLKRTARKTLHRYKLRKAALVKVLETNGMMPNEQLLNKISAVELYGLRDKAVREKISLAELGRILFHLNQKRGYRSSRKGEVQEEGGKKLSDYLQEIKERKELLEREQITIGQYFYREIQNNQWTTIKNNVFPRECYIHEFENIWETQQRDYPEILTAELKNVIKNEIIFYQRPLKSAKWLVGECRFEKHHKVTPISSPLFQIEKIWESVHNISLANKKKESYPIGWEQKQKIFQHLDNNDKLTNKQLLDILGLRSTDGWYANEQIRKAGIQGNTTKSKLLKAFKQLDIKRHDLLEFNLIYSDKNERIDEATGEIIPAIIDSSFEHEPLYQIWHVLYSIEDPTQTINTLIKRFNLSPEQAEGLSKLDFTQAGFGNKSARAIRKLLPALMHDYDYTKSCKLVGYNHSDSITLQENNERELKEQLNQYNRNSLRQPVVEKILNQLVNVVNAILKENDLGRPDEIRVELARELKQSKDERERAYKKANDTDKTNKTIIEKLNKEFPGLVVTRKILEKYKLHEQQNGLCLYSGENIPLSMALRGDSVDIDHIIPQSKLFDDSFQNKVLVWQKENKAKDNLTAYDYIKSKGEQKFAQYLESVNRLFEAEKITRSKRNKLLQSEKEIPDDFINRQLNESRYIAKEAVRLLKDVCRNVYSTTGSVTEFLRHQWGYNEVLKQLNWEKYDAAGLIKDGKIDGWSKRDDHRHHAIDALVVACTQQSHIQRLNTLNSSITRNQLLELVANGSETGWQAKRSLLEQSLYLEQPFTTQQVKEAVAKILISQKPGKRVAALGKNKLANGHEQRTLTPRGFLHKETVYGKIKRYSEQKVPLNARFNQSENIVHLKEKQLVVERLHQFDHDPKKAFQDLTKNPIWLDEAKTKALTEVTVWEEFFVVKYTLGPGFKEKDIESIIDTSIKEKVRKRFEDLGNNAFKDLENNPIWLNEEKKIPIKSVRCFTGLKDLVALHKTESGKTFSSLQNKSNAKAVDFVSTRNNHHIAIYETPEGKLEEKSVTLWESVVRKQLNIPVIVKSPKEVWDHIFDKGIENQEVLANLPKEDWKFLESLQQNEMFVFGMTREELENAIKDNKFDQISLNLFRVQKISEKDYNFRHHLETRLGKDQIEESKNLSLGKLIRLRNPSVFKISPPLKVNITPLGNIIL